MTGEETTQFFRHLHKSFPALSDWLNKHPDTAALWFDDFGDLDCDNATEAVNRMRRGDLEAPAGHSKFPAAIRVAALQIGWELSPNKTQSPVTYHDGEATVACANCLDSGLVDVMSPRNPPALILERPIVETDHEGNTFTIPLQTCVVACTCESGLTWANPPKGRPALRFDESRMCRIDKRHTWRQQRETARSWMENYTHPNHNSEFDDWGPQ